MPHPADKFWGPFAEDGMSPEAETAYEKQVIESEGFRVGCFSARNIVRPLNLGLVADTEDLETLYFLTGKAVKLYNSDNPADRIRNPRIVRVNYFFAGSTYYITFKAEDASGNTRKYQAEAVAHRPIHKSKIQFCRLQPEKAKRPEYAVPEHFLDEDNGVVNEMTRKKRKTSGAECQEDSGFLPDSPTSEPEQSTYDSGFHPESPLAEPMPIPSVREAAEEAVEPLKST